MMTKVSTADAIAELISLTSNKNLKEETLQAVIDNLQTGYITAERGENGNLGFRLTTAGKAYVQDMLGIDAEDY